MIAVGVLHQENSGHFFVVETPKWGWLL